MHTMKEYALFAIQVATLCAIAMGAPACGNSNAIHPSGMDASVGFGGDDASVGTSTGTGGGAEGGSEGGNGGGSGPGSPGMFGSSDGGCLGLGGACAHASDCCSADCLNGTCSFPSCTSDMQACTSNSSCCSQNCVRGKCAPLNGSCKTIGNACASDSECCSARCASGTCQASSFCGQPGDACSANADCCTGTCTMADGGTLGTCADSPPSGPTNCKLADGQLCGGTAPGGNTAYEGGGLPLCGGACCSRACAPWGPTGVLVCQPASGCHVVGDVCTQDSDCCGSAGLPGTSGKPVTCDKSGSSAVGVCRNPIGCKPDGDVCKLQTMSCNSSCDCCSGNCEVKDTCKQDNVGVPRCAGACVDAGGSCASSANCCGGAPCVPNPNAGGMPPYVCAGTQCIAACGLCTNNADCCPGTSCVLPSGSTRGVCGPCGGTGGGDGGGGAAPDSGPPNGGDAGGPPPYDAGGSCSQYGQLCVVNADCCNGVPCSGFRCQFPNL